MAQIDFTSLDMPSIKLAVEIAAQHAFDGWVVAASVAGRSGPEFPGMQREAAHHRAQANDMAVAVATFAFLLEHWPALEPVFLALTRGDAIETVDVAPQRKGERPALALVAS